MRYVGFNRNRVEKRGIPFWKGKLSEKYSEAGKLKATQGVELSAARTILGKKHLQKSKWNEKLDFTPNSSSVKSDRKMKLFFDRPKFPDNITDKTDVPLSSGMWGGREGGVWYVFFLAAGITAMSVSVFVWGLNKQALDTAED